MPFWKAHGSERADEGSRTDGHLSTRVSADEYLSLGMLLSRLHPLNWFERVPSMWRAIDSLITSIFRLGRSGRKNPAEVAAKLDSSADDGTIVALVITDEDRRTIAVVGRRNQWKLLFADSCDSARALLEQHKARLVLCDRDLPGPFWRDVVQALAHSPSRPCVILMSRVIDEYLWHETVTSGGYEVLSKPLREADLVRVTRLARSYWNSARSESELPIRSG